MAQAGPRCNAKESRSCLTMRVLFASDNYLPVRGGLVRSMCGLAGKLIECSDEAIMIVPTGSNSDAVNTWAQEVPLVRITGKVIPPISRRPLVSPISARRTMCRVFADWKPDVVHVMTPFFVGRAALATAKMLGIPSVLAVHLTPANAIAHSAVGRLIPSLPAAILANAYRSCGRIADLVAAPSQTGSLYARQILGDRSVVVISNGVSELPRHSSVISNKRGSDRLAALYVGRLSREKRLDVLLKAFGQLSSSEKLELVIVGDGPDSARLMRIASRNCAEQVRFVGPVSDDQLAQYYQSANIFCMPSPAELECVAALEALSFGLPIVAPGAGALAELAMWSGAVRQYERADSADQLARCLRQLVSDKLSRDTLAHHALEASRQRSISASVEKWRSVYRRLQDHCTSEEAA